MDLDLSGKIQVKMGPEGDQNSRTRQEETYRLTDFPLFLQDFTPFRGRCPKGSGNLAKLIRLNKRIKI